MQTFQCSAVLFDLDGVLVDSTRSVTRQWRRWAEENGIDPELVVQVAHGVRTVEVIRRLAPQLDVEREAWKLEMREAGDTDGVAVMPGAAELIHSIIPGRWSVVTSGTRELATARLKLANLPFPRVLISADEVIKGKPDPQPYLKAAQVAGFVASECLVIEDAPAGIQSAHAAGMKVIAITSTYAAEALNIADAVVSTLRQIQVEATGKMRMKVTVD
jgi:sugar-phosphatase